MSQSRGVHCASTQVSATCETVLCVWPIFFIKN